MRRSTLALLAFLLASSSGLPRVSAQDAYRCIDRLSDAEISHRLHFIEDRIDRGTRYSKAWYWGFLSVGVAAATVSWARFAAADHDDGLTRHSTFIMGVGASAMVVQMAALPMTSAFAGRKLRRLSRDTPDERRHALHSATRLLERASSRQALGSSVSSHLVPAVFGATTGTYLVARFRGEGTDLIIPSILAYGGSVFLAEARALLLPRQAMRDWELYRTFACSGDYIAVPPDDALLDEDFDFTSDSVDAPLSLRPRRERIEDLQVSAGFGTLHLSLRF